MELKKGMFVIAPEGCNSYLTAGKKYETTKGVRHYGELSFFEIIDDNGDEVCGVSKNDAHLKGKDWIIEDQPQPLQTNPFKLMYDVANDTNGTFYAKQIEKIQQLAKDNPNDLELGAKIRELLNF
jgi:hypothetical protein